MGLKGAPTTAVIWRPEKKRREASSILGYPVLEERDDPLMSADTEKDLHAATLWHFCVLD